MIALEPESVGACQVNVARPGPPTAATLSGVEGATPFPTGTYNNKLAVPFGTLVSLFAVTAANVRDWIDEEVAVRFAPQIAAAAPATCGAAIDVPLMVLVVPLSQVDLIACPGANKSTHDPILEKMARVSAEVVAPTVIASGTRAGE